VKRIPKGTLVTFDAAEPDKRLAIHAARKKQDRMVARLMG
jgi:predicted homoserine dehydrogenase-like protein